MATNTITTPVEGQYKVATEKALNMRLAGNGSAPIVASLQPRSIVNVTGPANVAGYAPAESNGWLGTDEKTLYCDSFSAASSVDAVIFIRSSFEAIGAPDGYGRQPGKVKGYVYLPYLIDTYKAYLEG